MAGTLVIDTLKSSTTGPTVFQNTSGTEIGQLSKAWVNFNGSTAGIRSSFNVSSISRNGTGDYTVNFTNALADANYSTVVSPPVAVDGTFGYGTIASGTTTTRTSSAFRFLTVGTNGTATDYGVLCLSVFR